jgi:anti-anti-sigma factor
LVDYEVLDRDGDLACLILRGELVGDVSSEVLKTELERHYVDDGVRTICVKLSELDLITLEGVGILLELWHESRNRGKSFVVQDPQGQVRDKLRVTGLLGPLSEP